MLLSFVILIQSELQYSRSLLPGKQPKKAAKDNKRAQDAKIATLLKIVTAERRELKATVRSMDERQALAKLMVALRSARMNGK